MPAEPRYVYSRPADLPGIEVLTAENNNRLFKVFHTTYAVCTMLDIGGFTEWRYRGRELISGPRHVAMMEPGETHWNTRTVGNWSFQVLFIDPALMLEVAANAGLRGPPHLRCGTSNDPSLLQAFAQCHAALDSPASLLARESAMVTALASWLTRAAERPPPTRAGGVGIRVLRCARDYLIEHWNEDVGLDFLARKCGLSRYHFLRAFRREFGVPPHQFQIAVRIEKARDLLRAGVAMSEIEAGFADQSHFIRAFRRQMGVTPGQYQRMMR